MILESGATGLSGSIVIRELAWQKSPSGSWSQLAAKAGAQEAFPTVELAAGDMLRPETHGATLHCAFTPPMG